MLSPSIVWLACLLGFCLIYLVVLVRRCKYYTLWELVLYLPVYLFGRLLWRVSFTNEPPQALRSGAVLAANHRSSVDPFFVQLAARRRVHWMVAREYCEHFLFGLILKPLQVIPTNRSGLDLNSTKKAMQYTGLGQLVGMFPEGKINTSSATLLPARAGIAKVAIKSNVPVIPLYIHGSPYNGSVWGPVLMPARVQITFGQPIYPQSFFDAAPMQLPETDINNTVECATNTRENQRQMHWLMTQWTQAMQRMSSARS